MFFINVQTTIDQIAKFYEYKLYYIHRVECTKIKIK